MDGPRDTKWSKSEKVRQMPYNIVYKWNLKYGTGASLVAQVKNPPANAGDMGSVPDLGRSHMPRSH